VKEKEIQELIANYPWLININYEQIPDIDNLGMEYPLSDRKRLDLILKDIISNRPVIVEFKATPFLRENIGQILEYKARVVSQLNENSSFLKIVFGNNILSPKLILIVSDYDEASKIACNLSGIDLIKYDKNIQELKDPSQIKFLEDATEKLKNDYIPVTDARHVIIESIYEKILLLAKEFNLTNIIKLFRYPKSMYHWALANFFINLWLFEPEDLSIGIYENIFLEDT